MASNLNNKNDQWELSLDIDDSDLSLTLVLTPRSSTRVETSIATQKPIRIIPGPAGIVQASKLLKQIDILLGRDGAVMRHRELSQEWKLDQVMAIVKSCSPNMIGDRAALILANISVFIPKPSMHYLNITI
ncbi:hypothetical protein Tco_1120245 [Tanacetum coccineum]